MITQFIVCWTPIISKIYYKMIAIDLSTQQAHDADPKAIQQISFAKNQAQWAIFFFIIEEAKETVQHFHKEL